MKNISTIFAAAATALYVNAAWALPSAQDRVYTADQNSNTVSVINPSTNTLVGQIRLGNQRPDLLSPLYKGQINVHGLGFSPDHKTLIVISNGSNSVSFIDTATNKVKGTTYIGRSPHEGFFTADGKEVWVVVRGEDYISVIDPNTFKETRRIQTDVGPGMVLFHPNGKLAFVVSSFTPKVDVIDVKSHKIVKKIDVISPFSPFLQFTPDHGEIWMTHKDVGKITRIDTKTLEVIGVFDAGFITNHLAFAKTGGKVYAYVTVGGENAVKVFTTDKPTKLVATISTGPLPHGIWTSDDSSRIYVGLENGDAVDVIDPSKNQVVAHVPVGQAPQALVYVSHVVKKGDDASNLVPRVNNDPVNIRLKPVAGDARGFVVSRNLGVVDALEVSLFKLKPQTVYSVYLNDQKVAVASFKTNEKGMANGTMIGPLRDLAKPGSDAAAPTNRIVVMEGNAPADASKAVLVNSL
ncbi:YncE family protein [Paralcaligenes ureilyticus]|uniref:YVTN family beta-propeller protein n=1 Tax=Paralcaligenes ureilyticus TaxID=627131 RepID=A0A4V2UZ78_9BURK|nr:YncE family protein [Paralcaligenes ureilyticus]TCT10258.1 YVTN family beta-propeller protein [Paralcaligenes ureilyticus]